MLKKEYEQICKNDVIEINDMMEERRIAMDRINKKFGLNISIELSPAWKKIKTEFKIDEEVKEPEKSTKGEE